MDTEFCFRLRKGLGLPQLCLFLLWDKGIEDSEELREESCRVGGGRGLDRVCCQLPHLILGLNEIAKATDKGIVDHSFLFF